MDAQDRKDPLPESFESIQAATAFCDNHDLSDYWDETSEAQFDVDLERRVILVPLEQQVARKLAQIARQQGFPPRRW